MEETLEQPRSLESQQSSIYFEEKSSLKVEESHKISQVPNEPVEEPEPTTGKPVSVKVTEKKIQVPKIEPTLQGNFPNQSKNKKKLFFLVLTVKKPVKKPKALQISDELETLKITSYGGNGTFTISTKLWEVSRDNTRKIFTQLPSQERMQYYKVVILNFNLDAGEWSL